MRAEQAGVSGGWGCSLKKAHVTTFLLFTNRLEHLVLPPGTAERRGWNGLPGGEENEGLKRSVLHRILSPHTQPPCTTTTQLPVCRPHLASSSLFAGCRLKRPQSVSGRIPQQTSQSVSGRIPQQTSQSVSGAGYLNKRPSLSLAGYLNKRPCLPQAFSDRNESALLSRVFRMDLRTGQQADEQINEHRS